MVIVNCGQIPRKLSPNVSTGVVRAISITFKIWGVTTSFSRSQGVIENRIKMFSLGSTNVCTGVFRAIGITYQIFVPEYILMIPHGHLVRKFKLLKSDILHLFN